MADIMASRNGEVALEFFEEVVAPAFAALDRRINHFCKESETDLSIAFVISQMEDMRVEMGQAFALSIQSIWERQLRRYLAECVDIVSDQDREGHMKSVQATAWKTIEETFHKVRGIQLEQMPGYAELAMLQVLGNVCRHGPGSSMDRLHASNPELWPWTEAGQTYKGIGPVVSVELLQRFSHAIDAFWQEASYIFSESIALKHPSLELRLQQERDERKGSSANSGTN